MHCPYDLIREGIFRKREKRFFAYVDIPQDDGSVKSDVAHVANTGSLKTVIDQSFPDQRCLLLHRPEPERKLKWTLLALEGPDGGWIGVDTSVPGKLIREHFEERHSHGWAEFESIQFEVKISKETRLDGLLRAPTRQRYFEIKNVSYAENGIAQFPDSVTERGQKHLVELMNLLDQGHETELIFVIQRTDVHSFSPAGHIDPHYAKLFREARKKGVVMTPLFAKIVKKDAYAKIQLVAASVQILD